jgi:drug/metabolite transporter (DMT)-like permease
MNRGGVLSGWINGFVGVLIFSGSLVATRIAVASMDPLFLTFARAAAAGIVAAAILLCYQVRRPVLRDLAALLVVASGVVIGFPLLTALALRHMTSAHAIVFVGLLPAATALFGVIRAGERPSPAFWLFAALGSAFVAIYACTASTFRVSALGDSMMVAAILLCGLGYAEGARLSRTLGGWQVICWALVLCLPLTLPLAALTRPAAFMTISLSVWLALAYVSLFSMLIGFFFWFRGLAQGGISAIGQLQLLQPFFGLGLASLVLHETVGWRVFALALAVMFCVVGARRFAAPGQTIAVMARKRR